MYIFIYNTQNGEYFDEIDGYDFEHAAELFYAKQTSSKGNYNILDTDVFKELIRGKKPEIIIKTVEALLRYVTIRTIYAGNSCYKREEETE